MALNNLEKTLNRSSDIIAFDCKSDWKSYFFGLQQSLNLIWQHTFIDIILSLSLIGPGQLSVTNECMYTLKNLITRNLEVKSFLGIERGN